MSNDAPRQSQIEAEEISTGEKIDVIIVGGGIGGMAAAVNLRQQGLGVRLYEKAQAFGDVGAGMQLAANCTRILDKMGLLEEAVSLGVVPKRMVIQDALDGREVIAMDLERAKERYGYPYMVIHRSDLHGMFLRAAQREGVELRSGMKCVSYENIEGGARVTFEDGTTDSAPLVIAADGLHSVARKMISDDQPVSSAYVAYRGAVPMESAAANHIDPDAVKVYFGPGCHFVQYALRQGEMFNQVAVFESPKALAGKDDWGTPDELDAVFEGTVDAVQEGLPLIWRDRWWRMFDRDPIMNWVNGRIILLGDSAHPPLQYMAQGAIMAIEDGWVLGEHVKKNTADGGETSADGYVDVDWDAAIKAYNAVRPEHCRRILSTGREWGVLWHHRGLKRLQRNAIMRAIDPHQWAFTDWAWGPTALYPEEEPEMFVKIPLDTADIEETS